MRCGSPRGCWSSGRAQVRSDPVFEQLGFAWVLVLRVRGDGEEADAIAWNTAYRGAVARGEAVAGGAVVGGGRVNEVGARRFQARLAQPHRP
jgi:hypothetical protein